MNLNYVIKPEQIKKYLYKKHFKVNIIGILFFMFISILINFGIFTSNKLLISIYILFVSIFLFFIILLVDYLFVKISVRRMHSILGKHNLIIDNKRIIDKINNNDLIINKNDIKKIKISDKNINIKINNKPSLVLKEEFFSKKDFVELKKYLGGIYDTTY